MQEHMLAEKVRAFAEKWGLRKLYLNSAAKHFICFIKV